MRSSSPTGANQLFGRVQVCSGIAGNADLSIGDAVEEVLQTHIRAGNGRYRGVQNGTCYDPDSRILGGGRPHKLLDKQFREGFKYPRKLGLSFDAYLLEPQLPELLIVDLAYASLTRRSFSPISARPSASPHTPGTGKRASLCGATTFVLR